MISGLNTETEIHMTAEQLKLLLEYLPEGIMLEISWEETDGRET